MPWTFSAKAAANGYCAAPPKPMRAKTPPAPRLGLRRSTRRWPARPPCGKSIAPGPRPILLPPQPPSPPCPSALPALSPRVWSALVWPPAIFPPPCNGSDNWTAPCNPPRYAAWSRNGRGPTPRRQPVGLRSKTLPTCAMKDCACWPTIGPAATRQLRWPTPRASRRPDYAKPSWNPPCSATPVATRLPPQPGWPLPRPRLM